jgi:hypothetical protein
MLGKDSFQYPPTSPWESLLLVARPMSNLKSSLQYTWLHLTQKFQDVVTAIKTLDENLLLSQSVERAGFYADGTHALSVTNALALEMETQQSCCLGEKITTILIRGEYEHWAWEAWTKMSATSILSPLDQLAYMEDEVFQVGITTYLGQPCPVMVLVMGRYFGKRGEQLDWYGTNLAASSLPGHRHRSLHIKLQSITQAMMKLGGIHSVAEAVNLAVNFLVGRIGHPCITSYVNHVIIHPNAQKAPHVIVPDLHAFNFPKGGQQVNDSGAMSGAEAFFEIITFTACKSQYDHNITNLRPVDQHAHEVILSYDQKFKRLDSFFAADVIGNGTSDVVGLFEAAKKRFFKGTVIPTCAGWFGEVKKDYKTLISTIAR